MRAIRLTADEAFIALIIAAMEASGHVAPAEAERAELMMHTLPRFRRRRRASVRRMIEKMRRFVRDHDDSTVIDTAAAAISPRTRPAALAAVAAIMLSDSQLQLGESAVVKRVREALQLTASGSRSRPSRPARPQSVPGRL